MPTLVTLFLKRKHLQGSQEMIRTFKALADVLANDEFLLLSWSMHR